MQPDVNSSLSFVTQIMHTQGEGQCIIIFLLHLTVTAKEIKNLVLMTEVKHDNKR
jgi:hypothetical protein